MPTTRWKASDTLDASREYLVLASSLPLRRFSSTWRMIRDTRRVRRQLAGADGLVGYSLLARPLRKQYATLSVWSDEEAVAAFVRTAPHVEVMRGLADFMGPTAFERWSIRGSDGVPSWDQALRRLDVR